MRYFRLVLPVLVGFLHVQSYVLGQEKTENTVNSDAINAITEWNNRGWKYRKSFPDSSIFYVNKALEKAKALGITSTVATSLNFIGVAYHYMGDRKQSYEHYIKAREYAKSNGDLLQYAHAMNNLGRAYFSQGDLIKSYEYYKEAIDVFTSINDKNGLSHVYKSMGNLYAAQKHPTKALEVLEKALSLRKELNDSAQITILTNISEIHRGLQHYEDARKRLLEAEELAEKLGNPINISHLELWISKLYLEQGYLQKALATAQKSLDIASGSKNFDLLSKIYFQMGKVHFDLKNYGEAVPYFLNVIDLATKSGELEQQKDSYSYLSKIYQEQNNITKSYEAYQKHTLLKDSLNNIDRARSMELMEARIEIEKLENKYQTLKALESKNRDIIKSQKKQNFAQSAALVLLALLVATLLFAYRRSTKMTQVLREKSFQIELQAKEIKEQNLRIQSQNIKLQKRNRKLGELNQEKDNLMHLVAHDLKSPFQSIQGLINLIGLTTPTDGPGHDYLSSIKNICKSGVDLIRDLLDVSAFEGGERQLMLTDVDLNELLLEKAVAFQTASKQKEIKISHQKYYRNLSIITDREYLSRILDNLLSNAIKYSPQNTLVIVKAYKGEAGYVNVSIKDEGPGFNEYDKQNMYKKFQKLTARPTNGEHSNGLGLAIVKVLSQKLNCKIDLITAKDKGSEFILKLPLNIATKEETLNSEANAPT